MPTPPPPHVVKQNPGRSTSEQLWAHVSAHTQVVVIDTEEIIHYWNGQAEALFGWSAEEAMGQKLNIILPVDLQNGKHSTYINRVLATGQLRTRGLVRGTHGVHRNGELVPVDLNVAVCAMTTSEATLFVGFFRSRKEEQKQDTLLMDTFPPDIVKKLLANPMAQIAERFESARCAVLRRALRSWCWNWRP